VARQDFGKTLIPVQNCAGRMGVVPEEDPRRADGGKVETTGTSEARTTLSDFGVIYIIIDVLRRSRRIEADPRGRGGHNWRMSSRRSLARRSLPWS
jgi:hypothetical protein